jgi:hypothetical protein
MGNGYNPISSIDVWGLAPGDPFDNPDAGAYYEVDSWVANEEYGGLVYELEGSFYSTEFVTDRRPDGVDPIKAEDKVPAGAEIVMAWHAHGASNPQF